MNAIKVNANSSVATSFAVALLHATAPRTSVKISLCDLLLHPCAHDELQDHLLEKNCGLHSKSEESYGVQEPIDCGAMSSTELHVENPRRRLLIQIPNPWRRSFFLMVLFKALTLDNARLYPPDLFARVARQGHGRAVVQYAQRRPPPCSNHHRAHPHASTYICFVSCITDD